MMNLTRVAAYIQSPAAIAMRMLRIFSEGYTMSVEAKKWSFS